MNDPATLTPAEEHDEAAACEARSDRGIPLDLFWSRLDPRDE